MIFFEILGKLFSGFLEIVKAIVLAVIKFVSENPVTSLVIVVVLLSNFATYYFTSGYVDKEVRKELGITISKLTAEVNAANVETEKRNEKIASVVAESKFQAGLAASMIAAKSKELTSITSKYEAAFAAAKPTYYDVKTADNADVKVEIEKGEVICRKFPSSFLDTVNELVDAVNEGVTK